MIALTSTLLVLWALISLSASHGVSLSGATHVINSVWTVQTLVGNGTQASIDGDKSNASISGTGGNLKYFSIAHL